MDENRFFENLRIGQKMAAGFGVTGLLFLVVAWQYHGTLQRALDDHDRLIRVDEARKTEALTIRIQSLEARRREKDFLLRHDLRYPPMVHDHVNKLVSAANRLEAGADDAGTAARIREYAKTYRTDFDAIVEAWRIKGLDHDSGLRGRFRETIHEVEKKAKGYQTAPLYLTLLEIRRAEKDLGLRHAPEYADRVRQLAGRFRVEIGASHLTDEDRTTLSAALDSYLSHFEDYARQAGAGGDALGGKGPFREAAHVIERFILARYVPGLERDLLGLRRHEKDYLLRGDAAYVAKADRQIGAIVGNVLNSGLRSDEKKALAELMGRYQKDFLELVQQTKRIATLTAEMREAVHAIAPLVEAVEAEAVEGMSVAARETREYSRQQAFVALVLAAVAALFGVLFAIFVTRRIVRPVRTLKALAETLTCEEFVTGKPEKKNEIVALAGAMGRMAGSHRNFLDQVGVQMDRLDAVARSLAEKEDGESAKRAAEEAADVVETVRHGINRFES
jgi:HAMP domain-containing protein